MKEYEVRCNKCGWQGEEEDLIIVKDKKEFIKACPHCKTDIYLIDIELNA